MTKAEIAKSLFMLPCTCANLRRASRAVTQLYAEQMRTTGLEPTQFTSLMVLASWGGLTQGALADRLAIDSTTLTRTLSPLRARGWIAAKQGTDRRERRLHLTPSGRRKLEQARPCWEKAQGRLQKVLGEHDWRRLQHELVKLAEAAREA